MFYIQHYGKSLHIGVIWGGNGSTINNVTRFWRKIVLQPSLVTFRQKRDPPSTITSQTCDPLKPQEN
jgi:hypothetical protein